MKRCKGITKFGRRCRVNGRCRWHSRQLLQAPRECIVCLNDIPREESALPCGHWIHRDCIQKHADAMQELRVREGCPPISEGTCAICRAPVPDIIPALPGPEFINTTISLQTFELHDAILNWMTLGGPLSFHIWRILREKYPDVSEIVLAFNADMFTRMLVMDAIPLRAPTEREDEAQSHEGDPDSRDEELFSPGEELVFGDELFSPGEELDELFPSGEELFSPGEELVLNQDELFPSGEELLSAGEELVNEDDLFPPPQELSLHDELSFQINEFFSQQDQESPI